MLILSIRTDKPESELGLYETGSGGSKQIDYLSWQAHRQLAETIHLKLKELLDGQKAGLEDLKGIVVYKGPGSFTGLRIGLSVANALADSLDIPAVGVSGDNWQTAGIDALERGRDDQQVKPEYGEDFFTTKPVK